MLCMIMFDTEKQAHLVLIFTIYAPFLVRPFIYPNIFANLKYSPNIGMTLQNCLPTKYII